MLHMKAAIRKKLADDAWLHKLREYEPQPAIVSASPSVEAQVVVT